jgi:hypothetical protein
VSCENKIKNPQTTDFSSVSRIFVGALNQNRTDDLILTMFVTRFTDNLINSQTGIFRAFYSLSNYLNLIKSYQFFTPMLHQLLQQYPLKAAYNQDF